MRHSSASLDPEHVQIDERQGPLDGNRRLHQSRNRSAPIDALPDDVLSNIFQQAMDPDTDPKIDTPFLDPLFNTYSACLSQALTLSAVSDHFRRVASYTPDLWKRIPLDMGKKLDKVSPILHHCIVLAPYVKVSVREGELGEETAFSVIETLFTTEMAQKVKTLDLRCSTNPSLWLKKLQTSSFPILDCLIIETGVYGRCRETFSLDLGALNSVTKLILNAPNLNPPIVVPSSVELLSLKDVPQKVQISIVYQCPSLVECFSWYGDSYSDSTEFTNPLTLKNLKRLSWGTDRGLGTLSSVQNLQLPSLETLDLFYDEDEEMGPDEQEFEAIKLLCSNVSTTLTTFDIHIRSYELEYQNLRQLFDISFPNLQKLEIHTECDEESPLNVLQALTPQHDEYSDSGPQNLPSLKSLIIGSNHRVASRFLLDLLKSWKVGKGSHFYFEMKYFGQLLYHTGHEDWSPELREELSLIAGERQINAVWDTEKL